ncbi:MAG TPA: SpoIIE family protein phosphatase [Pirellulales bacterium]|jgi:serine phosphatase RsbU (regulator of sigma subunit)
MAKSVPPYLKLQSGAGAEVLRPDVADVACLGELCTAFAEATGWPLRYVAQPEPTEDLDLLWSAPVDPGVGVSPGHLRIDLPASASAETSQRADWHAAERMAGSIAELVNELVSARQALWQREADLAAGVPVTPHKNEEAHLAARLEATLRAGAQGIRCDAAAVYLLDEGTSELKLRAAWGMPLDKFKEPARRLADQMADLEALLGHAVALEGRDEMKGPWRSPEPAAAALCVPVSSPTVPLGTLWFFSKRERPFTDEQTNIAEVVAGKIASDLERTMLLEEQTNQRELHAQVAAAKRTQENQLPSIAPPIAGWHVAGWSEQESALGGAFYDWRMIDDKSLWCMLGDACDGGIEAALAATALRAALRATEDDRLSVDELFRRANQILWESSAGNWWAGAWLGQIQLADGNCNFSAAGRPTALWLRENSWASLVKPCEPLGLEPQLKAERKQILLAPGESLVVCNRGIMEASDPRGRPMEEAAIAKSLLKDRTVSPERMIEIVRDWLTGRTWQQPRDRSIVVVKRLPS